MLNGVRWSLLRLKIKIPRSIPDKNTAEGRVIARTTGAPEALCILPQPPSAEHSATRALAHGRSALCHGRMAGPRSV